jgi:hypothetical protein
MRITSDPKTRELLAKLGEIAVQWNDLEAITQTMLANLVKGDAAIIILTAHMGSVSLLDALRTLSNEYGSEHIQSHVSHFLDFFEILRGYRNYYVHSIQATGYDLDGSPLGHAFSYSARRRLITHVETIALSQLERAAPNWRRAACTPFTFSTIFGRNAKPTLLNTDF